MPLPRPLWTCVATVLLLTLAPALPASAQVPPPATVPPPADVLAGGWGSGPAREIAINAADMSAAAGRTWLVEPPPGVLVSDDAQGTSGGPYFSDVAGLTQRDDINRAAAVGLTAGRVGDRYDPQVTTVRGQMATFLARLLDLLVEDGKATPPAR